MRSIFLAFATSCFCLSCLLATILSRLRSRDSLSGKFQRIISRRCRYIVQNTLNLRLSAARDAVVARTEASLQEPRHPKSPWDQTIRSRLILGGAPSMRRAKTRLPPWAYGPGHLPPSPSLESPRSIHASEPILPLVVVVALLEVVRTLHAHVWIVSPTVIFTLTH